MELHLNWSDSFTCSIECNIEENLPNFVPYTLKICQHADLPVRVVRPIKERWLARTAFHVFYVDFELIREGKPLTVFDTNCRTGEANRGGEWETLKNLVLRVRDFRDSEQHIRVEHKLVSFVCTKNPKNCKHNLLENISQKHQKVRAVVSRTRATMSGKQKCPERSQLRQIGCMGYK